MTWLRRRLTYPHVAATLALFLALAGGSAYGLGGTNVVDDNDPQNNIIESADVDPNALRGGDIDEATLAFGKVIRCNDDTPGSGGPRLCATTTVRGFTLTSRCQDSAGGRTAQVSIAHPAGIAWASQGANALQTPTGGPGEAQRLVQAGETESPAYRVGDFAATAANSAATSVFGEIIAGVNVQGFDCVLGHSAAG